MSSHLSCSRTPQSLGGGGWRFQVDSPPASPAATEVLPERHFEAVARLVTAGHVAVVDLVGLTGTVATGCVASSPTVIQQSP